MSHNNRRYDAAKELKKDLRDNGCCCCNAWCWSNFFLVIGLLANLVVFLFCILAVFTMYSPYDTVKWKCLEENGEYDYSTYDCDLRRQLEDKGYTKEVAIIALIIQCIVLIINILAMA
eukprot:863454_1